jgi:GT2 family glycosyltransferase
LASETLERFDASPDVLHALAPGYPRRAPHPAAPPAVTPAPLCPAGRAQVRGKFFFRGEQKLYLRGVTYGTFRPDADGNQYGSPSAVRRDFRLMAGNRINAVRTYTVPPRWLLDVAGEEGLEVMVGLPWEQHITFLDRRSQAQAITERLRRGVRALAGHEALFCFTVGNEIPGGIVRWHRKPRVEGLIRRLSDAVKEEDPEALVTYVNYPTTEYLELPFLDFVSFNVYLEKKDSFEAYLARLQNLAGNRPLVLAEIGLDSRRNGCSQQACALEWQVRSTFAAGCAGAFVFSWTDEWHRGGFDIEDWDFGLVTREREPKPALESVKAAYDEAPFAAPGQWPRISVVICSYNGAGTIRQALEHVQRVDYPDYEVVVVDDGSTDDTAAIAAEFDVRLIRTANHGLSSARNTGRNAATGEIIAYLDDDAYPDPHYLYYLAHAFTKFGFAAVGGPNLAPAGDGDTAEAVANAPGGPLHVLTGDMVAEHIPGCNFAVRRDRLEAIGGFDPTFRVAGDDVDVCWRLQEAGGQIGFHHAALVWHHRRGSVLRYLKQQRGYGRAEALLERKWPQKYNGFGHLRWSGQLYGPGVLRALRLKPSRVYHGTWGLAPFQSLYAPAPSLLASLVSMPEWYLVTAVLFLAALGGWWWRPLFWAAPPLLLALAGLVGQVIASVGHAEFPSKPHGRRKAKLLMLTAALHLLQPLARLRGRVEYGLHPWRGALWPGRLGWAVAARESIWSEGWREPFQWLDSLCRQLRERGAEHATGQEFDCWDVRVRGGLFGHASVLMAIEEHGGGKQLVRFLVRSQVPWTALALLAVLAAGTAISPAFAVVGGVLAALTCRDVGLAVEHARAAIRACKPDCSS